MFQPFSDFLVHDMGTLGDGIGNDGDSVAVTRRMRTAPLWGLRFRNLQAARRAHLQHRERDPGPRRARAAAARNAFNAATAAQRNDLVAFLSSL